MVQSPDKQLKVEISAGSDGLIYSEQEADEETVESEEEDAPVEEEAFEDEEKTEE